MAVWHRVWKEMHPDPSDWCTWCHVANGRAACSAVSSTRRRFRAKGLVLHFLPALPVAFMKDKHGDSAECPRRGLQTESIAVPCCVH